MDQQVTVRSAEQMPTSARFSKRAWATLTGNIGHFDLVDMASRDADFRDEVAQNLERLRAANLPATDDQIWNVLVHLAAVYPFPSSDAAGMKTARALYLATLRGSTLAAVKGAAVAFAKTPASFFPKPGEFLKLVEVAGREMKLALSRCEVVARIGREGV